jgi:hypothetical protein
MTILPGSNRPYYYVLEVGTGNAENNYVWPQVEHMGLDYRWNDPDSVTAITDNRPLDVTPNFRSFHLNDATEITDIISEAYAGAIGLLASPAVCQVISRYIVQPYEPYPAEVVHHGRTYGYIWLHMTELAEGWIDYSKSTFVVHRYDQAEEPALLDSKEMLRSKAVELANTMGGQLVCKRIGFLPRIVRPDLFALGLPSPRFFTSRRLSAELLSRGLTGLQILPQDIVELVE